MHSRSRGVSNDPVLLDVSKLRCCVLLTLVPLLAGVFLFACGGGSSSGGSPGVPSSPIIDASPLTILDTFEGATLYKTGGTGTGGFKVLVLKGDWHEMGRQYGYLLKDAMNAFNNATATDITRDTTLSAQIYSQEPSYMQELVAGMAETSGFSLETQKLLSTLAALGVVQYNCSQMSAWGDYTGGGPLVHGRNFDNVGPFPKYKSFLTVVVYNPTGAQHGVVEFDLPGSLIPTTAINSSGLFGALNDDRLSDPSIKPDQRMSGALLLDLLFTSNDIADADGQILDHTNLLSVAQAIHLADTNEGRVYECATYDVKRRTGNGLIAATNHFVDPSWTGLSVVPSGPASGYTHERLAHLLALGERYKGTIDAAQMMQIFDTPFAAGGATWPANTIYQVVAVPADRVIWVKAPGYSVWNKIDVGALFQ